MVEAHDGDIIVNGKDHATLQPVVQPGLVFAQQLSAFAQLAASIEHDDDYIMQQ